MTRPARARDAAGQALIDAIVAADAAWRHLLTDVSDVSAWLAHARAQALVRERRIAYTRARIDAKAATDGRAAGKMDGGRVRR